MMNRRHGLTRVETVTVIITVALLFGALGVVMLREKEARRPAAGAICRTNLTGLGTAMAIYANDYADRFPQLPGTGPWAKQLGFSYDLTTPDFSPGGAQSDVGRTVTASWYLLVRYADVSPKAFVCPQDGQRRAFDYSPTKTKGPDLVELWDFGPDPYKHVSYAMHLPYGQYPADRSRPASFAVAAEMNPWMKEGDFVPPPASITVDDWKGKVSFLPRYWDQGTPWEKWEIQRANAFAHEREGQNVLFGDSHVSFEKASDCGVRNDNIYTYWSSEDGAQEDDRRIGTNPTARDKDNDAKSKDDSFLVI